MVAVNVTSNIQDVITANQLMRADQLPFATSRALNSSAFDVRRHQVENIYPQSFNVVARSFARAAFNVRTASRTSLEVAVFDRFRTEFLPLQVESGIRLPRAGYLAVPTRRVRRTSSRRIAAADRPGAAGVFIADFGRGPALWRNSEAGGLTMLYVLVPLANIRGQFAFYSQSVARFDQVFAGHFDREFDRAVATAR